jgi:hypothetical protein
MKSATQTLPSKEEPSKGLPFESVMVNGGTLSYFGSLLARLVQATAEKIRRRQSDEKRQFTA